MPFKEEYEFTYLGDSLLDDSSNRFAGSRISNLDFFAAKIRGSITTCLCSKDFLVDANNFFLQGRRTASGCRIAIDMPGSGIWICSSITASRAFVSSADTI